METCKTWVPNWYKIPKLVFTIQARFIKMGLCKTWHSKIGLSNSRFQNWYFQVKIHELCKTCSKIGISNPVSVYKKLRTVCFGIGRYIT